MSQSYYEDTHEQCLRKRTRLAKDLFRDVFLIEHEAFPFALLQQSNRRKVIKTAHARAHFLHAILSQIIGNVIESVHVLYFMQRKLYYRWILF